MIFLANSRKVVRVKPAIDLQLDSFFNLFKEAMDLKNCVLSKGTLTAEQIIPEGKLGIFELCQEVGISHGRHCDTQKYFYQRGENKYIGTINLLAEILHNKYYSSQDLGIMIPNLDDKDKMEELDQLIEVYKKFYGAASIMIIERDYPDFALFFENIANSLILNEILEEKTIDEVMERKAYMQKCLPGYDPDALYNNIEVGQRNLKVLQLARALPDYMKEEI